MESISFMTELAQNGVFGICIALIIAMVLIVRTFVGALQKCYETNDQLKTAINELSTQVAMLSLRTQMTTHSSDQSAIIRSGTSLS